MEKIVCENLSVGYDKVILKNINLTINDNEFLVILGENGSGKSTLIKTIIGLLKPLSGEIKTNNLKIGYLPQQNNIGQNFPATVMEVVLTGFQSSGNFKLFYKKSEKEKVIEILKKLNISKLVNKQFKDLSGGEKQKVLLARALCLNDNILVLDEPINALDPSAKVGMYNILEKLHKEGKTIIMISHDIDNAIKYATHILHVGDDSMCLCKEKYLKSNKYKAYKLLQEEKYDR